VVSLLRLDSGDLLGATVSAVFRVLGKPRIVDQPLSVGDGAAINKPASGYVTTHVFLYPGELLLPAATCILDGVSLKKASRLPRLDGSENARPC